MSNSGWWASGCGTPYSASTSGSSRGERAAVAQHRQHPRRVRLHQSARELLPDALGGKRRELARRDQRPHQRLGLGGDDEAEARGEARDPQHAQRILGERRRDVPQHAGREVAGAAVGIDQRAVGAARHRVDRQVAPREVVLERHLGRREELEAAVALAVLALGARERVLLARLGVQEHREIAPDRPVARRQHRLGRRADDDPVAVDDRAARGARRGPIRRRGRSSRCAAARRGWRPSPRVYAGRRGVSASARTGAGASAARRRRRQRPPCVR